MCSACGGGRLPLAQMFGSKETEEFVRDVRRNSDYIKKNPSFKNIKSFKPYILFIKYLQSSLFQLQTDSAEQIKEIESGQTSLPIIELVLNSDSPDREILEYLTPIYSEI